MIFDRLVTNDIVCWNSTAIKDSMDSIPNASLWKEEQFGCYMTVTDLVNHGDEESCTLTCTTGCGQHLTETMTRSEYLDYFDAIGTDVFVFPCSIQEVYKAYSKEDKVGEVNYDFVKDFEGILDKVRKGTLPSNNITRKNKCQT